MKDEEADEGEVEVATNREEELELTCKFEDDEEEAEPNVGDEGGEEEEEITYGN